MKSLMGSSSSSSFPSFKLVSCKDNNMTFLSFNLKDDLRLPLHHSCYNQKKKNVGFRLEISVSSTRGGVLPVSLSSSSQTQAEIKKHDLKIEESSNGYISDVDDTETRIHGRTVHVRFKLQKECSFGQNFLIVGDDPMFGLWDPNNAVPLTWSEGHVWTVDLDIPTRKCIKFKFIMQETDGKFVWQPGPDRVLECWETQKIITLCEDWENPDLRTITETDPTFNQEINTIAADEVITHSIKKSRNPTEEPKEYAMNMKRVLESDEGVPVLVPGSSRMTMADKQQEGLVTEGLNDEPEPMNRAAMVSAGADIANELKLPELNA